MCFIKNGGVKWGRLLLATLCIVALVFAGVFWFDIPVANFLRQFNWKIWHVMAGILGAKVWICVSFFVVIVFYIRKLLRENSGGLLNVYAKVRSSYAFWVFCAVLLSAGIGGIAKVLIGRARPVLFYDGLAHIYGFFPPSVDWLYNSMPSGHTMVSFAGLAMIGMLAPRARWFYWTLAVVIGVSRICAGAHWPSDVILGAFIGVVCANLVRALMMQRAK